MSGVVIAIMSIYILVHGIEHVFFVLLHSVPLNYVGLRLLGSFL